MWSIPDTVSTSQFTQLATDPYASPALIYGSLVHSPLNNQHLYTFGGHHPEKVDPALPPEPMRYYMLDMASLAWSPLQKVNSTTLQPLERYWHSTALHGNTAYIFGGMNITGPLNDYFWAYDFTSDGWRSLSNTAAAHDIPTRCGHTANMLSNGQMVILGGYACVGNYTTNPTTTKSLFPLNEAVIYDSIHGTWHSQRLIGSIIPDARTYHTAVTSLNYHTIYDGLYIFDADKGSWLPEDAPLHDSSDSHSVVFIAGMAVLGICLGAILLAGCIWFFKRKCITKGGIIAGVKRMIWHPRTGEPLWAELSRLLFRVLFFGVFIAIVAIIVLQVRNSPIIDQQFYRHADDYTIDVPDIRFCFDGWYPDEVTTMPFLRCATDFGDSCSQYIINITDSVRTGLDYYGEQLTCFLFRSPSDFRLGRTSDRSSSSSGSYLKFHYYGDHLPSNQSRVHVTFYHKYHDPNLPVYNIPDPYNLPSFHWYSKDENAAFQAAEQANLRTDNAFDLDTNSVSTGSYQLSERQVIISDNAWNKYAGIGTARSVMYQIQSQAMSEPSTAHYHSIPAPMGAFHVFPSRYEIIVSREQRAFTLLNAMGIIGGISGLLLGLQALLFGFRPRSPWGWVHRWSFGQMRRSLLHGLRSRFPQGANVPIVHPVHRRFSVVKREHQKQLRQQQRLKKIYDVDDEETKISDDDDDSVEEERGDRMARLEERLHVFELLFQAYYINDEVFRSLAYALKPADHPQQRKRQHPQQQKPI
ncbi:hypothetical protein K492DRAFT_218903 [Lichtheimia hyalospora FSU 10163]|nr:hypothetical protein K492DRAFT_218903 [Lichtheimia hyalospora FSU 10163]